MMLEPTVINRIIFVLALLFATGGFAGDQEDDAFDDSPARRRWCTPSGSRRAFSTCAMT